LIAVALSSVRATAKPLPIIPLDEGTEWIYSARVRWTVINSNHERGAAIQWRTRVVKSFKTDTAMAAVISGFPTDLAWYEPGEEPGYSVSKRPRIWRRRLRVARKSANNCYAYRSEPATVWIATTVGERIIVTAGLLKGV
jgi:hypothetical protein